MIWPKKEEGTTGKCPRNGAETRRRFIFLTSYQIQLKNGFGFFFVNYYLLNFFLLSLRHAGFHIFIMTG